MPGYLVTAEEVVKTVIDDVGDIYDEEEIRGWLLQPGEYMSKLPQELRTSVLSIEVRRDARDVMLAMPYWITVHHFLDYWNDLSIADRIACLASDTDEQCTCGCGE